MKTHTPGPWLVEDGLVQTESGSPIALLQNELPGRPIVSTAEMHANGLLIASAPALLAALELCADKFDDFNEKTKGQERALREARAAIALARGEAIAESEGAR